MASSADVLRIAGKELGTCEDPRGSNCCRYTNWYPMDGSPWCAMFVSWVLDKAGVAGYKHAYTPTGAELFRKQGRFFTSDPKPGDVVYFNFPDSLDRIQHVGFVEKTGGSSITTIEGNTSSGEAGSQDNGEGVYRRVRPVSHVVGYGRPGYNGKPDKPEFVFPKRAWFGRGDEGADIKRWQIDLNRWVKNLKDAPFSFKLEVDAEFGPDSVKATKTFQNHYQLDVDGRVGTMTLDTMERIRKEQRAEP
jgi:peptidoglycan hydrolase-like protein with peptidoglycan-binding domain